MWDVAASPNDPIFINHHAMIDCIFEVWMKQHPDANYPKDDQINNGHKADDYIVPFLPLYTHEEMFKNPQNFGYSCSSSTSLQISLYLFFGLVITTFSIC